VCHFKEIRGTSPFLWLILNWVGRIVCSNEPGGYASGRVATGSVTQAGGFSA